MFADKQAVSNNKDKDSSGRREWGCVSFTKRGKNKKKTAKETTFRTKQRCCYSFQTDKGAESTKQDNNSRELVTQH